MLKLVLAVATAAAFGCGGSQKQDDSIPPSGQATVPPAEETTPPAETPPATAPAEHPEGHGEPGHGAETPPAAGGEQLLAAEKAAYEKAKPVFEKYCVKCHTTAGKKAKKKSLDHLNMDSYPFGGHHAHEIGQEIRKTLGAAGKEAKMPLDDPGAVKGDELKAILAWADTFDKSHAAGLHKQHQGGGHEH